MSGTTHGETLGRGGAKWPAAAKWALVIMALAVAAGGAAWYAVTPSPARVDPRPRPREAAVGLGAEFVPAASRAPMVLPVARPEPDPPLAAPDLPAPPPDAAPIRLATMWGVPGIKGRSDAGRRGGSSGGERRRGEAGEGEGGSEGEQSEYAQRMRTTRNGPIKPSPVRLNDKFTIEAGTKIACKPPMPISSEMVGPVDCYTQGEVRGIDGTVVLLPDNTHVHGMIERGLDGARGDRRLFMVWQSATTPGPDRMFIEINAPAADPMGQIGLPGDIDRRVWERYGPTLALSVVDFLTGSAATLLRDTSSGSFFNFGSLGGSTGRTLGQMAFERDQAVPKTLTRGPARMLTVYIPRHTDLSEFYDLRTTR